MKSPKFARVTLAVLAPTRLFSLVDCGVVKIEVLNVGNTLLAINF